MHINLTLNNNKKSSNSWFFVLQKQSKLEENEMEADNPEVNTQVLQSCLFALCSGSNLLEEDVHQICLEALIPSHVDIICMCLFLFYYPQFK